MLFNFFFIIFFMYLNKPINFNLILKINFLNWFNLNFWIYHFLFIYLILFMLFGTLMFLYRC